LSRGNGRINETNVSAFLGFLLNSNEVHGLQRLFLMNFISAINKDKKFFKDLYSNNKIKTEILKEYIIKLIWERPLKGKTEDRIDILIEFNPLKVNLESYLIGIELKINEKSVTKGQLTKYEESIKNLPFNEKHLIYLSINGSAKSIEEFKSVVNSKVNLSYLEWEQISDILKKLLEDNSRGIIDPININTLFTIQGFLNFIESDFADDKDEASMNYKVIINNSTEIFENRAGQMIRQICKYLIERESKKIDSLNSCFSKTNSPNSKLIQNQDEFDNFKTDLELKIKKGEIASDKIRRFHKEDEIINVGKDKYYVSTEITLKKLETFLDELKKQNIIEESKLDKQNQK
jgi:hypothetical protein